MKSPRSMPFYGTIVLDEKEFAEQILLLISKGFRVISSVRKIRVVGV